MTPALSLVTLGVADLHRARASTRPGAGGRRARASPRSCSSRPTAWRSALRPRRARRGRLRGGQAHRLLRHHARLQLPLEGRGGRGLRACRRGGRSRAEAPAGRDLGRLFGLIADPDGHLWEVAWNPFFPLDERGNLHLPDSPRERTPRLAEMGRHGPGAGTLRRCGLSGGRARGRRHRREPAHGDALADPGIPRLGRGPRFHAVLCDELHLRGARGRGRLSCGPVQHRRGRAGAVAGLGVALRCSPSISCRGS